MSWTEVIRGFDRKIQDECRAGILVGFRLPISDTSAAALAVQRWAAEEKGVELWIVDDLLGLAPEQPIFAGICIHQAFGLDDDHRIGLTMADLEARALAATLRMASLGASLEGILRPYGKEPGPLGSHFVWSGPLCGGFLVKGVFQEEYPDEDLWFDTDAPCPVYESSRGARQDTAPGGVRGVELFFASYDASAEPPVFTAELLASGDERLAMEGLLKGARIFVLPHYD